MHSILHILNASTDLMSAVELMSGAKSRKWVHQKPTNQPICGAESRERVHQNSTKQDVCCLAQSWQCLRHVR